MLAEAALAKKKRSGSGHYGDYLPFKNVRIPLELYNKIAAVAKENFRPVSWQIRQFMEAGLQEHYRKHGTPAPAPDEPAP